MTAAVIDDRRFVDGVMERIAEEPVPTPARALRAAVATLDAGLAAGATWTAWHLATSRDQHVRRGTRIRSALLVAMLMALLAMGTTLAAAGATVVFRQLSDDHSGLAVILPPTTPGTHPTSTSDAPREDAPDESGGDHGGAPGPDAAGEPGDDDDSGDEVDNGGNEEGSDDPGGHDGDNPAGDQEGSDGGAQDDGGSGVEGSPDASEPADAHGEDQVGEAAEPTYTPNDDDSPGDGGQGGEED
jgi:hypothetical protein